VVPTPAERVVGMIRRTTWILVVIFLLVLGGAVIWQRSREQAAAQVTPTQALAYLFEATNNPIQELTVTSANGERVVAERGENGIWTLVVPEGQSADVGRIEEAAVNAGTLQVISSLNNPPALIDVGLEPARYEVQAILEDGQQHTVFIGNKTPTEGGYYAYHEGGSLVVVDPYGVDSLIALVNEPPIALTPSSVVTIAPAGTVQP
jgi:hypothetical protein